MRKLTQDDPYFGLAEIKSWLRLGDNSSEDDVVAQCLNAAVDFYENATGLYLRKTKFSARYTESPIELVVRPWKEINSAKDDDDADISVTRYEAAGEVTRLEWDSIGLGALNIEFTVGITNDLGTGRGDVPDTSAQAVRAITADCYVNRNFENPVRLYPGSIAAGMLFGEARTSV